MSRFSLDQMKSAKAIVNYYETGSFKSKYDTLTVLGDGAGITYGRTQTTENSGGLWDLIFFTYKNLKGVFISEFEQYRDKLYKIGGDSSLKSNMENNEDFKSLLIKAAQEDPLMGRAQDQYFHIKYFRPALELAEIYDINTPLILAVFYDISIQSGPSGMDKFVEDFDESFEYDESQIIDDDGNYDPDLDERHWGENLVKCRQKWLSEFKGRTSSHTKSVRKSVYRMNSFLDLIDRDEWELSLPLKVKLVTGYKTLTEDIIKEVW
jgi:hypothetical protein